MYLCMWPSVEFGAKVARLLTRMDFDGSLLIFMSKACKIANLMLMIISFFLFFLHQRVNFMINLIINPVLYVSEIINIWNIFKFISKKNLIYTCSKINLNFLYSIFQAKKEIYDVKQQRLCLAQDEYNHLNNALSTLGASRTSCKFKIFFFFYSFLTFLFFSINILLCMACN